MQPTRTVPPRGRQPTQPHTLQDPGPAKPGRRRPQPRASPPRRCRPDRPPAARPHPTARGHALHPPRCGRSRSRRSQARPHHSPTRVHHLLLILSLIHLFQLILRPPPPCRPHPQGHGKSQSRVHTHRPPDPHAGDSGTQATHREDPPPDIGALTPPDRGPPLPGTGPQPQTRPQTQTGAQASTHNTTNATTQTQPTPP